MTTEKHHWPPGMKTLVLFAVAIAIAVGLAIFTILYQTAHPSRVDVLGMCIPKSRVTKVVKAGDFHPISGPWTLVTFTSSDMMKAIPGWTNYQSDGDILAVGIFEDVPKNRKLRLSNPTPEMYELTGPYKRAKVTELGHSGLFKVVARGTPGPTDSWELLFVDPRKKNKPPVAARHLWNAGTCYYASPDIQITPFCGLDYVNRGLLFNVTVTGKNILLTRQVDAFLSRKVHEWRAACHATS